MSNLMAAQCSRQLHNDFAEAVSDGLSRKEKALPCAYLYDDRGSELFEDITHTAEYYPTRTEIGLLKSHSAEIAELIGAGASLVEFGSGSSRKTGILIEALQDLRSYIPIDISDGALEDAERVLNKAFPRLRIVPVHGDFNQPMDLPNEAVQGARLGFFPGSTLGNFTREKAGAFLAQAARLLGSGNGLLIGIDVKKDISVLEAAYNDAAGVTADFNLNLLDRINRELEGDFERSAFAHRAYYNSDEGRIEIYIESLKDQSVSVLGERFHFAMGERIHTENSHKYSVEEFVSLAEVNGWHAEKSWVDPEGLFSMHFLWAK